MKQVLLRAAFGVAFALSAPAAAEEDDAPSDAADLFRLGGSCAGLGYLDQRQIEQIVQITFQDELHAFCYPEDPFECSDYIPYLQGMGMLEAGEDSHHCRLHLTM